MSVRRVTVSFAGCALVAAASVLGLVAAAAPAGAMAPQPVDASEQGGIAFVLFAVMCGLFAASLFYMDRVRRRRSGEEK